MLYVFFWVIPRRLNFICRRFETLCLFHLHRQVVVVILQLPAYEDGTCISHLRPKEKLILSHQYVTKDLYIICEKKITKERRLRITKKIAVFL
jgi:hypothetical protein